MAKPHAPVTGYPSEKCRAEPALVQQFTCTLCLDISREPVTCNSGAHIFCLGCATESVSRKPECPNDRSALQLADLKVNLFAKRSIESLDTSCILAACEWIGTLGRFDEHVAQCPHALIVCDEIGCGMTIPRARMADHKKTACMRPCGAGCGARITNDQFRQHLNNDCPHRQVECPHDGCHTTSRFKELYLHVARCDFAPFQCPLCEANGLTMAEQPSHTEVCPAVVVPCVYSQQGCVHRVKRGDLQQHVSDTAVHFPLLVACHTEALCKNAELQQQLDDMREESERTKRELCAELASVTQQLHALRKSSAAASSASAAAGAAPPASEKKREREKTPETKPSFWSQFKSSSSAKSAPPPPKPSVAGSAPRNNSSNTKPAPAPAAASASASAAPMQAKDMNVSQLKRLLAERGVDTSHLLEKSEFVAMYDAFIAKNP